MEEPQVEGSRPDGSPPNVTFEAFISALGPYLMRAAAVLSETELRFIMYLAARLIAARRPRLMIPEVEWEDADLGVERRQRFNVLRGLAKRQAIKRTAVYNERGRAGTEFELELTWSGGEARPPPEEAVQQNADPARSASAEGHIEASRGPGKPNETHPSHQHSTRNTGKVQP